MRIRWVILGAAALIGLIGMVLVAAYVGVVKKEATSGRKMVWVYAAKRPVTKNSYLKDSVKHGWIRKTSVPRKYVADGALRSLKGTGNKLLAVPLKKGQQVTEAMLYLPHTGIRIERDKIAVAVPIEPVALMNKRIKAGDHVVIFVTLKKGPDDKMITRLLLRDVLVLSTQLPGKQSPGGQQNKASLTVALKPGDAEKLVFAVLEGRIWTGLKPPKSNNIPLTYGQTQDTIW